jgi:PAS domain S-box-containing protein
MTDPIRVLYVDDEPDLLEICKLFLEESGDFIVMTALSADEGIRLLEQENIDAIISDYQMPGMDGIQFLVEVRKRFGPIPFILFTGRGREEVVIQAINSGADFYFQKGGEPGAQFAELSHKIKAAASSKRADDALRKSEEKYRHLIEHANEAIVVAQDGMLKLVNHKTIEFTGYSEQELLSMQFSAFIHADDRAMVVERYQKQMKGEEAPSRYAFRLSSKDVSTRWVELSVVVIDWDERPATLNFLTDITERKRADEALSESETRYREFFTTSRDSVFITSPMGRWIDFNDALMEMFGYESRKEMFEVPVPSIYANPKERPAFLDLIGRDGYVKEYPMQLKQKDGTVIDTLITTVPVRNPDGSLKVFIGTIRDVTERKRVEEDARKTHADLEASYEELTATSEELHQTIDDLTKSEQKVCESEERYRTIFENTGTATVVVEESNIISLANTGFANLSGLSKDAIEGKKSWTEFVVKEDLERMLAQHQLRRQNHEEAITHYEFRFITKSGDIRNIYLTIGVIPGTKKSIASLLDITESKRAEEALLKNAEELSAANEQIAATEEELRANLDELTRQERALRNSKKELSDIIEFLPDATFAINTSGVVIAWNHAMEVMMGVKKEDMLNKGNYEYSLPLYLERRPILIDLVFGYDEVVAEKYQEIRKDGDRLTAEIFIPHFHNGKGAYLWFTTSPLYDSQGNIAGAIESIREITEHKERESALNLKNEELSAAYEEITSTEEELRQQVEEIAAAQQALQESENQYRNIVKDQTEFISRFLPDGTHIFVNDAYCRYFGLAQEDIIGHRFRPVLHADDRAAVFAFFASLTPEKPVGTIDQRTIMPDGTTRWQRWSDRALFDEKGNVVEYQSVGRDITDYKRAEGSIKKSEEMFRGLVDTITSGVAIYEVRNDGTSGRDYIIKDFNKMALKIEGKNKDEVVGRSLFDLRPAIDDYGLITVFQQVWKSGVPAYFPQKVYRDEKYSNWYENRVFRLPSGEIVAVYDDVTERKLVELELLSYQEKLKEAHRLAHIGTWDWVIATDTVTWSEELYNIAGLDVKKPAPTYAEQTRIYTPSSWKGLNDAVTSALTNGQPYNLELEMVRPDGSIRWTNAFGGVIRDTKGTVTGLHGTVQDITERKQAEVLKNRFGRILESSLNEIYIFDAQTLRFVDVNYGARENIGYTMDELRTMTPLDITTEYTTESFETLITPLRTGEKEIQVVFTVHKRKDGTLYPIEVHLQLAGNEVLPVFVAIVLDITERKQTEEALRRANWKLNLLSGITRHDIKNQMTVLRGYIVLLEKKLSDPSLCEYIRKMDTSARRISSMIQFTKEYEELGITVPVWQEVRTLVATAANEISFGEIHLKNDLPAGVEVFAEPLVITPLA